MLSNIIPQQNYFVIFNAYCNKNNPPQRQKEFMNSKLALMPLLIMSAFSYAADEAMPEAPVQQQLQEVHVRADAKRVKAARSYSIASDGDLRDRVNLGVLGKANAFTAPITVVNYDEQALNNTEARTLVDAVAKKDASVWQFGGESNTLTGLYFRGYQLDARQFSVNGLAGMYGTQGTASVQVGSAQLIKGASTAAFIKPPALDAYEALSLLSDSNSFRIALSENFGCFKVDAKRGNTFSKLCTGTVKP